MIQKIRTDVNEDLESTLKKFRDSHPPPPQPTPPTPINPPQPPQAPPSVSQLSIPPRLPGPMRRSRPPAPTRAHHRESKRPVSVHRSPPRRRARSTYSMQRHRRHSRSPRGGSLRRRSVSWSPSYDFQQLDPPRRSWDATSYDWKSQSFAGSRNNRNNCRSGWSSSRHTAQDRDQHQDWRSDQQGWWDPRSCHNQKDYNCDCICASPAAVDFKNLEVDMWWHAPNMAWPLRKDDMNMPLQNGSRARRKSLA